MTVLSKNISVGENDGPSPEEDVHTGGGFLTSVTYTDRLGATVIFVFPNSTPVALITQYGTLTIRRDGRYTYTPDNAVAAVQDLDNGETLFDSFTATEGASSNVSTITINGVSDSNAPPVTGGPDSASGSEDDASINGSVPAATDADADPITYHLVAGSVEIDGVGAADGTVTVNTDGTYSYVPDDQDLDDTETRTITFDYVASDGTADSAAATVTITVNGANDAPELTVADNDVSGTEDTDLVFSAANLNGISVDDVDGDTLTVTISVAAGTLTLSQTTNLTVTGDGTDTVELSGSAVDINAALDGLVYRGDLNYEGSDTLEIDVDDGTATIVSDSIAITLADDLKIDGTSGNDVINGTPQVDILDASQGGDDEVNGLASNDGIYMGDELSAGDDLDGGGGASDQLILQGNVTATILGNHTANIEVLSLLSGSEARLGDTAGNLYDYNITMDDAAIGAGQRFRVWFAGLGVGEDVYFDGSAETDGAFTFFGGLGVDHLIGGAGDDFFFFGDDRFAADHVIAGNGGNGDTVGLRGDYSTAPLIFEGDTISGVETMALISANDASYGLPGGTYGYNIALHDLNVASGETLAVWGLNLSAGETMIVDGSSETDGDFRMFGGAAADTLTGGSGNDMLYGALGGDTMTGGGGNDNFVYRTVAESAAGSQDSIVGFSSGDKIDLSFADANSGVAGRQAFNFIGGNAFSNTAGELRAVDNGGGSWTVEADVDGDGAADFVLGLTVSGPGITVSDFVI